MSSCFVVRRARGASHARLFCFPHAGGGPAAYRGWGDLMPRHLDLYVLNLPGRERLAAQRPHLTMASLLEDVVPQLVERADLPYAFFGHSMGAYVAFEVARAMRRRGDPLPAHLFLAAAGAPRVASRHRPRAAISDAALAAELHAIGGLPAAAHTDPELLDWILSLVRADLAVLDSMSAPLGPPLTIPISVLVGSRDPYCSSAAANLWSSHTSAAFSLHPVDGDHFFPSRRGGDVLSVISKTFMPAVNLRSCAKQHHPSADGRRGSPA